MRKTNTPRPPRWAERFLSWYCRPELLEDLQGDLHEYFVRNVQNKGRFRANMIYLLDVLKFFRLYTVRKPRFSNVLVNWIMLGSYMKTSVRNMLRNQLFSAINVIGLAISMTVGLLLIAFLTDLLSYDQFHEKKHSLYRVITTHQHLKNPPMTLASTSVAAGKKIRDGVPGVEDLTILRRGFYGDAIVKDNILPLSGFWADNEFFKVFSFELLHGDINTALKEPYSIVLTKHIAQKLFGEENVVGRSVRFDTVDYVITGVLHDLPKESHIRFESLVSFATVELEKPSGDGAFDSWQSVFSNYVYLTLVPEASRTAFQENINRLAAAENKNLENQSITLALQPSSEFVIGKRIANPVGPTMPVLALWVLGALACIVILSACFNYTNLSIARSLRRSREVGIRKVIGALKGNVLMQFIAESVIISMLALVFSFVLFLLIRKEFLSLSPHLNDLVSLSLSTQLIFYFIALAIAVGIVAGFLPAWYYARINVSQVLKSASSIKVFRHINLRKALIVIQYTFSLIFILTTFIGYHQYKSFVSFDLGFKTENILNIHLQGNKDALLIKELNEIPAITKISRSRIVTSVGSMYGGMMKTARNPLDSSVVWMNYVDENYLPLHEHRLLTGRNFDHQNEGDIEHGVIVNEQALKQFQIAADPQKALGEEVMIEGKPLTIIGVIGDFHYGTVEEPIAPVALRYSGQESNGYLNVRIASSNIPATMEAIERAWKKIDQVHPLGATFYDEQIQRNYAQFSVMVKVIGFVSFLAIAIASMGLFGMVVFTTEKRLKEISIRKVLGANEGKLVFMLSKGFLFLLLISAMIAIPATYVLFDKLILTSFAYHAPIDMLQIVVGVSVVFILALLMIASQTLKVARSNPAEVLKSE